MELDFEEILKQIRKKNPEATLADVLGFLSMMGGGSMSSNLSEEEKQKVLNGDVSVKGLIKNIENYNNIIVLSGAGISVNAGIPDFRSPKTGLYDNLKEYGLENPTDVFSISFFARNPIPFFQLTKKLLPEGKVFLPTKTHHFVKLLHDKGKLLRVYTQNIDGLEIEAGVPEDKVVESHGHYRNCRCIKCKKEYDIEEFKKRMYSEKIPVFCEDCKDEGLVKPDVVFFGEGLPKKFFKDQSSDFEKCDLMIVMGTSLVVAPFCSLVNRCKETVPRLLFNMEKVGPWQGLPSSSNYRDVMMLGDVDEKTDEFRKLCGWIIEEEEKKEEEEEQEGEEEKKE